MAILVDTTVTGVGDIDGYNPAPLTLYSLVTDLGQARTHDVDPVGRWFDIGWIAPYFHVDPDGSHDGHYQFAETFIVFEKNIIDLHQYTGGLDGIHYYLGPGVQVRFWLTDD